MVVKLPKAVFLDRDGTINEDPGYINHPDQLHLIPGVGEGLAHLASAGFLFAVVSNQSGVARGIIDKDAIPLIHARVNELLRPFGVEVHAFEVCTHHPEDGCECRKPKAKLIHDAAERLGVDVRQCYMVGDRITDLEAGKAAGCRASLLVRTGEGAENERKLLEARKMPLADFVGDTLIDVARWIVEHD